MAGFREVNFYMNAHEAKDIGNRWAIDRKYIKTLVQRDRKHTVIDSVISVVWISAFSRGSS